MPGSSVLSDLDKSPSAFGCDGNGTERNQVVFYLFWCLYFRCHTPYMIHREGKVCLSSPRYARLGSGTTDTMLRSIYDVVYTGCWRLGRSIRQRRRGSVSEMGCPKWDC